MITATRHILIAGGGVTGICAALTCLVRDGRARVTLFEKADAIAQAASGANACQLSFDSAEPVARPGFSLLAARALAGRDGLSARVTPGMAVNGLRFARESRPEAYLRNRARLKQAAKESKAALAALCEHTGIGLPSRREGKIYLFDGDRAGAIARRAADGQQAEGITATICEGEELSAYLPGGALPAGAAGMLIPGDLTADCAAFCRDAVAYMQETDRFTLHTGTDICGIATHKTHHGNTITALRDDKGTLYKGDNVVFCPGAAPCAAARAAGFAPVFMPVAGVTLRYAVTAGDDIPACPVTLMRQKAVIVPMENILLISGAFTFGARGADIDVTATSRYLHNVLCGVYPAFRERAYTARAGARACAPDSLPVIQRKHNAVYAGASGMYGWTLAAYTAQKAAEKLFEAGA